ncbi:uncharacterized protein AB675_864 [Cyphellophora attinorum]|uniref:Uncharacterized protein n=1 Tax=Cyphellophora attinorum TaxID=1664694 RepID=A0A0N1HBG5_9EURO|nr:uncharacterized protein AB675_864 [Phialophora attinorum]KPI45942.1 hypothetical protein AB675_864 [Phialophora attinorum]
MRSTTFLVGALAFLITAPLFAASNPTVSKKSIEALEILKKRQGCGDNCTAAVVKAVGIGGEIYEWSIHRFWTEGVTTGPISTISIDAILTPEEDVTCAFSSPTVHDFWTVNGDVASKSLEEYGFPQLAYIQCSIPDDPLPCPEYPCCDGVCD